MFDCRFLSRQETMKEGRRGNPTTVSRTAPIGRSAPEQLVVHFVGGNPWESKGINHKKKIKKSKSLKIIQIDKSINQQINKSSSNHLISVLRAGKMLDAFPGLLSAIFIGSIPPPRCGGNIQHVVLPRFLGPYQT